ncbi:MAG: hypothetical protein R3F29_04620 [Planctomycetota bacterium]
MRRNRGIVVAWVVIGVMAFGIWAVYVWARDARDASEVGPAGSSLPKFEALRDEWKVLADEWRAQQKAAAKASDTGSFWTDRDDDAYRILGSVSSHLEELRRLEARQERTAWIIERLDGDRHEWDALVVNVAPEMPDLRRR